jgi:uncharacterized membrane protein
MKEHDHRLAECWARDFEPLLLAGAAPCHAERPWASSSKANGLSRGEFAVNENIIGLLCYVGGWVTGLIFFLIDKRPFVRFHAAQSIVTFGGVNLAYIILTNILVTGFRTAGLGFFSFSRLLFSALSLGGMVLWIVLMVKAYQGERFRVPSTRHLELRSTSWRTPGILWASERLEHKKAVLKLAFADRLAYVRDEGFRTPDLALPSRSWRT